MGVSKAGAPLSPRGARALISAIVAAGTEVLDEQDISSCSTHDILSGLQGDASIGIAGHASVFDALDVDACLVRGVDTYGGPPSPHGSSC